MLNTLTTFEDFIRLKRTDTENFYSLNTQRKLYLGQKCNPDFFHSYRLNQEATVWK